MQDAPLQATGADTPIGDIPIEGQPLQAAGPDTPYPAAIARPVPNTGSAIDNSRSLLGRVHDFVMGGPRDPGVVPSIENAVGDDRAAVRDWETRGPSWGAIGTSLRHLIPAQYEQTVAGGQEAYGAMEQRTAEQTLAALNVLPQVAARTPGSPSDQVHAMARDPNVAKVARGVGMDPKALANMWQDMFAMSPAQQAAAMKKAQLELAAGQQNLQSGRSKRDDAWAIEKVWQPQDVASNVHLDPFSLKGLAFQSAMGATDTALIAGASIAGGVVGGPPGAFAAGGLTAAGVFGPRQYAQAQNQIDDRLEQLHAEVQTRTAAGDAAGAQAVAQQANELTTNRNRIAGTYGLLSSVADVAGALPVVNVLSKTPGSQLVVRRVVGAALAKTVGGRIASAAITNGAAGAIQGAIQKGLDAGILHESTPLKDALKDIGSSGLAAMIQGTLLGAAHELYTAPARRAAANNAAAADILGRRAGFEQANAAPAGIAGKGPSPFPGYHWDDNARRDDGHMGMWVPDAQGPQGGGPSSGGGAIVALPAPEPTGAAAARAAHQAQVEQLNTAARGAQQRSDLALEPEENGWAVHVNGQPVARFASKGLAQEALAQARKLVSSAPPAASAGPAAPGTPAEPAAGAVRIEPTSPPVDDRTARPITATGGETTPPTERRVDTAQRQKVAQMSTEQLRAALLTHELSGIPNRRAYDESAKKPTQVSVDMDSLKAVNDSAGHAAGDQLIQTVARILHEESGGHAYHTGGDEFVVQADHEEHADRIMDSVNDRLNRSTLDVSMPDGRMLHLKGLGVSYGLGNDLNEADAALQTHKALREQQGLRAPRGQLPAGATVGPGETGGQGRGDHRTAEVLGQAVAHTEPSAAQAEAGNYKHPTIPWQGLTLAVENLPGSPRRYVDDSGKPGEIQMRDPYGYVRGENGADGEGLDVFMGADPDAPHVYVVDRVTSKGKFDEHKALVGYDSEQQARKVFKRNYSPGAAGLSRITQLSVPAFKHWIKHGDLTQPIAHQQPALTTRAIQQGHTLSAMAERAGWQELGGKGVMNEAGETVGTTTFIPHEEWFRDVQNAAKLPHNNHGEATRRVVAKAVRGEKLGAREARHIEEMLRVAHVSRPMSDEERAGLTDDELDDRRRYWGGVSEERPRYGGQGDLFGNRNDTANEIAKLEAERQRRMREAPDAGSVSGPDLFNDHHKQTDIEGVKAGRRPYNPSELIVQHNLSGANLLHAHRVGGIAAPSLAVTSIHHPMENFGNISLLGDRDLADPTRGTKMFGSDLYAPRYPTVHYRFAPAALKRLAAPLKAALAATQSSLDPGELRDGPRYLERHPAVLHQFLKDHQIEPAGTEPYPMEKQVRAANLEGELEHYAVDLFKGAGPSEHLFHGYDVNGNRRYRAHTLEAVVRQLKQQLRGGESDTNLYGAGQLRAAVTPQFRSIEAMKREAHRLVSHEQFKELKDEANNELIRLANGLSHRYPHDAEGMRYLDTVIAAMHDSVKQGVARAFKEYGFSPLTQEESQLVSDFLAKLRNMPTEYFEGKILRGVGIHEFRHAVVPHDTPQRILDVLKQHGVQTSAYRTDVDGDRTRAIQAAARSFSGGVFEPRAGYEVGSSKAALKREFIGRDDQFWGITSEHSSEDSEHSRFADSGYGGVQCTGYACAILQKLGAQRVQTYGFHAQDNPHSAIARADGGHDFAVVDGRYIVDPWLEAGYGVGHPYKDRTGAELDHGGVYDLTDPADAGAIHALYGPRSGWQSMNAHLLPNGVTASRRAYGGTQLALDFTGAQKPFQFETRPDTTPKQVTLGRAFLANLIAYGDRLRGAKVLADAIATDFIDRGATSLIGKQARTPDEMALLAQVYRNPKVEKLRVFLLKGDTIVEQLEFGNRMPGAAGFENDEKADDFHRTVRQLARSTGATGFMLQHNHPSGTPMPSTADLVFTGRFTAVLPQLKFLGHIIVDHNVFGHIDDSLSVHIGKLSAGGYNPHPGQNEARVPHPLLGRTINSPAAAAAAAKALDGLPAADHIVVMATDSQGRLKLITDWPAHMLSGTGQGRTGAPGRMARLRRLRAAGGAGGHLFALVNAGVGARFAGAGAFDDVIDLALPDNSTYETRGLMGARSERHGLERSRASVAEERDEYGKPFYSGLLRAAEGAGRQKGTAAEWMGTLRNLPGVKREELEYTGLEGWLAGRGRVSKQELTDYLRAHEIQLGEVWHGESPPLDPEGLAKRKAVFDRYKPQIDELHHRALDLELGRAQRGAAVSRLYELEAQRDREADALYPVPSTFEASFSEYRLAGGQKYRELLMTLPTRTISPERAAEFQRRSDEIDRLLNHGGQIGHDEAARRHAALREEFGVPIVGPAGWQDTGNPLARANDENFQSSHWQTPNVLAHIRFDERTDADGKKVLHLAEVQSDWHQSGRKRGYRSASEQRATGADLERMKALAQSRRPLAVQTVMENDQLGFDTPGEAMAALVEHRADWRHRWEVSDADAQKIQPWVDARGDELAALRKKNTSDHRVPDAPYKTTWPELAMKRMLRFAAEHGFDRLSWDTGETNAARYDLSKHIRSVAYNGTDFRAYGKEDETVISHTGVRPEDLPDLIGKDAADKLLVKPWGTHHVFVSAAGNTIGGVHPTEAEAAAEAEKLGYTEGQTQPMKLWTTLEGLELKVGGEGMGAFYDKMLPSVVNKVAKRYGAQVQRARVLPLEHELHDQLSMEEAEEHVRANRPVLMRIGDQEEPIGDIGRLREIQREMADRDEHLDVTPEFYGDREARAADAHAIDITPQMRAELMRGQAVFEERAPYGVGEASEPYGRPEPDTPAARKGYELARRAVTAIPESEFMLSLRRIFDPANVGQGARDVAVRARRAFGELAQESAASLEQLEGFARRFDLLSPQDRFDFIDDIETGSPQRIRELQPAANVIRTLFDTWRDRIRELGVGALDNFIENYFPHIWADPDAARTVFARMAASRRPLQGSKSFLKQRTIPTFKEGLAAGLRPLTTNPLILTFAKLREMQRFHAGVTLMQQLKEDGLARFLRAGKPMPEGWAEIQDAVGRVLQWSEEEGGFIIRGRYVMPADGARVLNNHLSGSALRNFAPAVWLRVASNAMNALQLGFSAFHLGFTTLDAIISKNALAIERLARGEPVGALRAFMEAVTGPGAVAANLVRGARLARAYRAPEAATPDMQALVRSLAEAGGRVRMDNYYAVTQGVSPFKGVGVRTLMQDMRAALTQPQGQLQAAGSTLAAFPAQYAQRLWRDLQSLAVELPKWQVPIEIGMRAIRASTSLIMEHIVPLQKLGVFSDLAADYLRTHPTVDPIERAGAMQRIWNSVDNRLGELVYDNVFWNRTLKDVLHLMVRAVGWNLGTLREIGGAPVDAVKLLDYAAGKAGLKDAPETRHFADALGHKISYVLALAGTTALIGALIQKLRTGKDPQTPRDLFFPQTGGVTKYGTPERMSMPSYAKDIYEYAQSPAGTLLNKANPMFSVLGSIYQNQDFYGNAIRDPDASLLSQLGESAAYAGREMTPFSIQGSTQFQGDSAGLKAAPFVGFSPAPARVTSPEQMRAYQMREDEQGYLRHLNRELKAAEARRDASAVQRLREDIRQHRLAERSTEQRIRQGTQKVREAPKSTEVAPQLRGLVRAYPALADYGIQVQDSRGTGHDWKGNPYDGRELEYYAPGDSDNPHPGSPTLELFADQVSDKDLLGDVFSHLLPSVDPAFQRARAQFIASVTAQQRSYLDGDYQRDLRAGPVGGVAAGTSFDQWLHGVGGDAFFRGYVSDQYPRSAYTAQQIELFKGLLQRLKGATGTQGAQAKISAVLSGKSKPEQVAALHAAGLPAFAALWEQLPKTPRPRVANALEQYA